MRPQPLLHLAVALAAGCAQMPASDGPAYAERMKRAGELYVACMTRESEKDMKNPLAAEDIATAAHSRCWSAWDAYRGATRASFMHAARTPEERQLAHDKAEAHLRQFEREARRSVVDTVVNHSIRGKP